MATTDVFLSYAREDAAVAEALERELSLLGWTVWRDNRIQVADAFDDSIEAALDQTRCVVVIWSPASVRSHWVRAEASEGQAQGKLVPVSFHDDLVLPILFRQTAVATLSSVRLDPRDGRAANFIQAVARRTGRAASDWTSEANSGQEAVPSTLRAITAGNWAVRGESFGSLMFGGHLNLRLLPNGSVVGDIVFRRNRKWKPAGGRHGLRGRWRYDLASATLQLEVTGLSTKDRDAMSTQHITITAWRDAESADCTVDGRGRWSIQRRPE